MQTFINIHMKSKAIIGIIAILATILGLIIISFSNNNGGWFNTPTASLTNTATPTRTALLTPTFTLTPTAPFIVVCTPPPCAIGTNEIYFCPGVCPGGCGTTCATYTPTP
jgi:hypothetical protein